MNNGYLMCSNIALSKIIVNRIDFEKVFSDSGLTIDKVNQKFIDLHFLMKEKRIGLHQSNVNSRFGDTINTRQGAMILDNRYEYSLMNVLFTEIKRLVASDSTINHIIIRFGYLTRFMKDDCTLQVEDASYIKGSSMIVLDYFVTPLRTNEGLLKLLIHEMLHVLGFDEYGVEQIQDRVYHNIKENYASECANLILFGKEKRDDFLEIMGTFYEIPNLLGKDFREILDGKEICGIKLDNYALQYIPLNDEYGLNADKYFCL